MEYRQLSTAGRGPVSTDTMRRAGLIAGVALALMAALAGFAVFGVLSTMIIPGDAVGTAQRITASASLFRVAIACLIVVVILDVVVAIALFAVFSRTDPMVAATAAAFRIAYAAVYLVAISQLVQAVQLLDDPGQALRAIDTYTTIWNVGLILFAVHLLLIGFLAYRSGFMAKVFGILLTIAGLGYLVDGFGFVLAQDSAISLGQFTFVGEVVFIFWLIIRGRRSDFRHHDHPTPHRELEPGRR